MSTVNFCVISLQLFDPLEFLASILLRETSTFGVRVQPAYRYEAEREVHTVDTPYGPVPVKLKILDGQRVQAAPEYEACARLAAEKGLPLIQVYNEALRAGLKLVG